MLGGRERGVVDDRDEEAMQPPCAKPPALIARSSERYPTSSAGR